ncbi:MAG TPA: ribosome maturation factor RimM [Negativicutes bacterium]|jgi:16S rRNA processing protein RimM
MSNNLITIGKIVAPHGVRGDVRVIPLTDFPERFQKLKTIILDKGITLDIENVKYHKQAVLLKFRGLDDMNAVEHLRGKLIQIEPKDLVVLPEGQYYHFDIVGLKVYTVSGDYLGVITDILVTGSNDVYIIEQNDKPPVLIPALREVVTKIDIAGGQMIVKLQEEWE